MKSSTCMSLKLIVSHSPLALLFLGITPLDATHRQMSPSSAAALHPTPDRPAASRRPPAQNIVEGGRSAGSEGPVRAWRGSAGAGGGSVPASGLADTFPKIPILSLPLPLSRTSRSGGSIGAARSVRVGRPLNGLDNRSPRLSYSVSFRASLPHGSIVQPVRFGAPKASLRRRRCAHS
jgi:hypothetical protein